ncbi:pullulanase [Melioribacteraceae bacterium 4301-Me]|uniref:alpha-amylase family glycosyl hydrolase n=1 Tax=Pyranulibacter aquaticus TaxID=3163344 RepID=UPI0035990947
MKKIYIKKLLLLPILIFLVNSLKGEKLRINEQNNSLAAAETNKFIQKQKLLDKIYSDKKLGSFFSDGKTYFRLFAPNAVAVKLCIFKQPEDATAKEYSMIKDTNGVWEKTFDGNLKGIYYGYKVYHEGENLDDNSKELCIDPYSKAVATYTTYMNPRKSIVYEDSYDWEGDNWVQRDWRDLIIYEMHIRDMTADPSSGAKHPGTYKGLIEKGNIGGINYIKSLGINTVELLPSQDFGYIEIPYKKKFKGMFNTWNPYERNHWGYMTAAFFAPASYYAEDWAELKWNAWMGKDGKQVKEFKDMIKAFHKEGIGVIMDVVYNHLSEYEIGNLKQIDKEYYFRLDDKGNFIAESYCGNDIKTERPMVRRLIIESVLYWMKEYHIDGFRFDLGKLIDWETIEDIIKEAKKINPYAVFVCEPWGGGYDPQGFSIRGWGSWNDQIRNGIKGENPFDGLGWIFGKWYGNNNLNRIKSYVNGTLVRDYLGLFQKKEHSVNYLESHDGYTLGDFIRIATGELKANKIIKNVDKNVELTPLQLKLNKLAALFLLTSQGIVMISEGQEFARSKVIPYDISVPDSNKGRIDNNSYNKDNSTNYINYRHAEINKELLEYYKGLIKLRNTYSAFRRADYKEINFIENEVSNFALAYTVSFENDTFFVAFNPDQKKKIIFNLPKGSWQLLVNEQKAGIEPITIQKDKIVLEPISGMVLKKN